jgi:hypothetical protein
VGYNSYLVLDGGNDIVKSRKTQKQIAKNKNGNILDGIKSLEKLPIWLDLVFKSPQQGIVTQSPQQVYTIYQQNSNHMHYQHQYNTPPQLQQYQHQPQCHPQYQSSYPPQSQHPNLLQHQTYPHHLGYHCNQPGGYHPSHMSKILEPPSYEEDLLNIFAIIALTQNKDSKNSFLNQFDAILRAEYYEKKSLFDQNSQINSRQIQNNSLEKENNSQMNPPKTPRLSTTTTTSSFMSTPTQVSCTGAQINDDIIEIRGVFSKMSLAANNSSQNLLQHDSDPATLSQKDQVNVLDQQGIPELPVVPVELGMYSIHHVDIIKEGLSMQLDKIYDEHIGQKLGLNWKKREGNDERLGIKRLIFILAFIFKIKIWVYEFENLEKNGKNTTVFLHPLIFDPTSSFFSMYLILYRVDDQLFNIYQGVKSGCYRFGYIGHDQSGNLVTHTPQRDTNSGEKVQNSYPPQTWPNVPPQSSLAPPKSISNPITGQTRPIIHTPLIISNISTPAHLITSTINRIIEDLYHNYTNLTRVLLPKLQSWSNLTELNQVMKKIQVLTSAEHAVASHKGVNMKGSVQTGRNVKDELGIIVEILDTDSIIEMGQLR